MVFDIKVILPSGKSVRVKELKNKDYFTILKFCENRDLEGFNTLLDHIIFNTSELKALNLLDKFYLLLIIRMFFIDPNIYFKDKTGASISYDINHILQKIDSLESTYESEVIVDNFKLKLGLPTIIYFNSLNDLYISIIEEITFNNKSINFIELSEKEKEEVLAYLPNKIFTSISKFLDLISSNLQDLVLIDENKTLDIKKVEIDIISNGLISFIMEIFSSSLKDFYEMLYIFCNRLKFTGDVFYDLTPLDTRVIFNIYNKDMEDREKELKMQRGD